MPGPLWLGVGTTALRARQRRAAPRPPARGVTTAWVTFVAITLVLSWIAAAALGPLDPAKPPSLLDATVRYAIVLGWQPVIGLALISALGDLTPGPRRKVQAREVIAALGLVAGCLVAALGVAWLAGERSVDGAWRHDTVALVAIAAMALVVVQASLEEYGWRGVALDWAVTAWGPRRGLVVHGAAWGLGYAPLAIAAVPHAASPTAVFAGTVLTAAALGVVLGWTRLRAGNVIPTVVANVCVTVAVGLPLVLVRGSLGPTDALVRWPGWLVLVPVTAVLLWRVPTPSAAR